MTTVLAAIFALGILIFIHEFGHFILAKLTGMRVERFSLGFPPRMVGKKIGDTDYCISWIPLGGYVKISGMIDESLDRKSIQGRPWEFQSKPLYQRAMVIAAGPAMNFLLAILLFSGITFVKGIGEIEGTYVGEVMAGYPAEKAGIKVGDRIVAVNGKRVASWEEMAKIIHNCPDKVIRVEWERDGRMFSANIRTVVQKAPVGGEIREVGLIGIGSKIRIRRAGLLESLYDGTLKTLYLGKLIIVSIKMLITGEESLRSLAGPIFITKLASESARSGFWSLLAFMAFLSLNLAILNILPIPVLDGGHLTFLAVEGITRKPVPVKTRMVIQQVGMAILAALFIFIIFNDLRNMLGGSGLTR